MIAWGVTLGAGAAGFAGGVLVFWKGFVDRAGGLTVKAPITNDKIEKLENHMQEELDDLRTELKQEIASTRTELKSDMRDLQTKFDAANRRLDEMLWSQSSNPRRPR